MKKKQARFWIYTSGPVRIKINAGQTLNWSQSKTTDEGWDSEAQIFEFDGQVVTVQAINDGRDCDGRLTHYFTHYADVSALQSGHHDEQLGIRFPKWEVGERSQCDEYAEAMNY